MTLDVPIIRTMIAIVIVLAGPAFKMATPGIAVQAGCVGNPASVASLKAPRLCTFV
jgi:hypothetical protein